MIIDARSLPDNEVIETTVCIAGGGAAGLTLAHHLISKNISVCVVESGNGAFDTATQDLANGENIGLPYDAGSTSFRFLGGNTNAWGGLVRPISEHCFNSRNWVGSTGWPFARQHLDPYYEQANAFLGVTKAQLDPDNRLQHIGASKDKLFLVDGDHIETRMTPLTRRSIFKDFTKSELLGTPGFKLLLNANLVSIETSQTQKMVKKFKIKTLCGKTLGCKAKIFVLAMGGIENPRILLLSDKHQSKGLGNTYDLVGRYFMEHPRVTSGRFHPYDRHMKTDFYDPSYCFNQAPSIASLSVTANVQRKERLLDHKLYIIPVYRGQDSTGYEELTWQKRKMQATRRPCLEGIHLKQMARDLPSIALAGIGHIFKPRVLFKHFSILHVVEPAPNPNSRVTLGKGRDKLGCPRICVDWQLGSHEKHTIIRSQEILSDAVQEKGLAKIDIDKSAFGPESTPVKWAGHHMGTTRMDPDPRRGVVNVNCQLHGTQNLYVASSSVFPTVGDDVPTLTIVALAIRLADHIAAKLSQHGHDSMAHASSAVGTRKSDMAAAAK